MCEGVRVGGVQRGVLACACPLEPNAPPHTPPRRPPPPPPPAPRTQPRGGPPPGPPPPPPCLPASPCSASFTTPADVAMEMNKPCQAWGGGGGGGEVCECVCVRGEQGWRRERWVLPPALCPPTLPAPPPPHTRTCQ